MRFLHQRFLAAQRARQPPDDGIDDDCGRRLASREDVISDADLVLHQVRSHPLVHSLVVAAEQNQAWLLCQAVDDRLVEQASLRRQQDEAAWGWLQAADCLDGAENRVRLEHHARAAAVRRVVHGVVRPFGPVSQIVQLDIDDALRRGARHDARVERATEHLREEGNDIDAHGAMPGLAAARRGP